MAIYVKCLDSRVISTCHTTYVFHAHTQSYVQNGFKNKGGGGNEMAPVKTIHNHINRWPRNKFEREKRRELCKVSWKFVFLIHEADPQSRQLSVRTYVPTFQILAKQNKFQAKTMFTSARLCGLAEWIIEDTCLVVRLVWKLGYLSLHHHPSRHNHDLRKRKWRNMVLLGPGIHMSFSFSARFYLLRSPWILEAGS